ncbi:MAG: DUF2202 domain-containing protein [Bacteroidales bacterium]|nr:DUF2202 domain-containing protein [Bacteroidales bacterium]
MKTQSFNLTNKMLLGVILIVSVLFGCSKDDEVANPVYPPSSGGQSKSLSAVEKQDLLYIAEKEKLMHDIYQAMYRWNNNDIFAQIRLGKAEHLSLLSLKIDKYGLENPIAFSSEGEYQNTSLQEAYNDFKAKGVLNNSDAIEYGKSLEESLIGELGAVIGEVSGNSDLVQVYNKILTESKAHLEVLIDETKETVNTNDSGNQPNEM